jgi:hypothetical protein
VREGLVLEVTDHELDRGVVAMIDIGRVSVFLCRRGWCG